MKIGKIGWRKHLEHGFSLGQTFLPAAVLQTNFTPMLVMLCGLLSTGTFPTLNEAVEARKYSNYGNDFRIEIGIQGAPQRVENTLTVPVRRNAWPTASTLFWEKSLPWKPWTRLSIGRQNTGTLQEDYDTKN